ncbi:hypothetical protein BDB00DRAFT_800386 [Zychaea mexicana]|uniref:uncharacterized protein n=1 Tax=Zychaea mexicana TaxID=64656 RepID=UPI0022FED860|nr:uncharacterized protein BDB00DRAFT_800386 [Zychaea mexicana]KAI9498463.1 hypothetical protein BDB00DRAFT_800386 [Zychaea mexicana]
MRGDTKAIAIYVIASLVFASLTTVLALWPTHDWSNFYNARPVRGEMGLGRFLIRGTRYGDGGRSTPFAYAWRLVDSTSLGRLSAWIGYLVHQLGQWLILAKVQQQQKKSKENCDGRKDAKGIKWSNDTFYTWNWQMVYLNGSMMLYKLLQTHTTYDGLAVDVSEGTAQGSVIAVLVVALLLAIPSRGIAFGKGKKIQSLSFKETLDFVKKYHGYVMSFGTVYNFHYHPAEGTMGHLGGFFYQCLLLWQSASFYHQSHRNKYWVLLLETWVFIHGTVTAIIQPGTNWQIFSYGFAIVFLVNQVYDTPIPKRYPWIMASMYTVFSVAVALGFQGNRAYYKMTFVPVAEYLCLFGCIGIGMITAMLVRRWHLGASSVVFRAVVVALAYIAVAAGLTIGLALVLAGNLKVYNDY